MDRFGGRARRVFLMGLILLTISGLGLLGGSWLITYTTLHAATRTDGASPADPPALSYKEVSFMAADGVVLRGWHLPGRRGATVILVHGFARDRSELLPEARWLVERGYGALLFDTRGQGASGGISIGLGYSEALDVCAGVDFLLSQAPEERVGVMGYSMGAVAAIEAAARDLRIAAVLAVSPYATLQETIAHRLRRVPFLAPLVVWWGERLSGLKLSDMRPIDRVALLAPRPLLIMQAEADGMLPPDSGARLFQAASQPKELWSVPGVAHVDFRQAVPRAYQRRVLSFFQRYLPLDSSR
jgi:alpha-beta hydrolase superfamily lysophospholipase